MAKYRTPEEAHTALIDAIEHELDTYGPASLADVIASLASARYDYEDNPKPTDAEWIRVTKEYEDLANRLASLSISRVREGKAARP